MMSENNNYQARNKFNTLTPAEARKLNKYINHSRPPIRTASVLNKPRPPPIIITNLDSLDGSKRQQNLLQDGTSNLYDDDIQQLSRANSIRSASVCPSAANRRDRRHSINYGAALRANTLNSRLSLYSTNSCNPPHQYPQQFSQHHSTLHNDSNSNLSYKSSQDIPDSAYHSTNSARLQTMSVDLGSGMQTYRPPLLKQQSMFMNRSMRLQKSNTIARTSGLVEPCCLMDRYKNSAQKISDDSYVSARSDISDPDRTLQSGYGTPQRQLSNLSNKSKRSSISKNSLTSSTYKVFQGPFANIKRFFRNSIPRQLAATDGCDGESNTVNEKSTNTELVNDSFESSISKNMSELSLGYTDSNSLFNRSQTPPVCPPPPGELKSMSYMNGTGNYSNYDEFTRLRNERLNGRPQSEDPFQRQTSSVLPRLPTQPPPVHRLSSVQPNDFTSATHKQQQQPTSLSSLGGGDDDTDSWHLTSLPVCFERNLATVFEDQKQQQQNLSSQTTNGCNFVSPYQSQQQQPKQSIDTATYLSNNLQHHYRNSNLIKPPTSFDNSRGEGIKLLKHANGIGSALTSDNSKNGSNQSLASTTTTDSILEYQLQRQVPASPYRFSFTQPLSPPAPINNVSSNKINGLPPKVPTNSINGTLYQNTTSVLTDSSNSGDSGTNLKKNCDNNSSSGNSSNCSSQLNVINNCDNRLNSLESSDKTSYSNESSDHNNTGGNLNGLENDIDTTILSETSTLQGDATGASFYMNKCGELERAVTSLKNKLISREKELTDLQLSQLHNDYTIDKLKSQVNKLEKENIQLKNLLSTVQRSSGQTAASKNTIPKFVRS